MTDSASQPLRVLVTGASGFIGRHVVHVLAAFGHDVVALQRGTAVPEGLRSECAAVILGDICDPAVRTEAVREVDTVCHFAAHLPSRIDDPMEADACIRVNEMATLELARAAAERGTRRFVYASAGNAYCELGRPSRESDPIQALDPYFASKLAGEARLMEVCERSAMEAVALRIGTPYGPGELSRKVVPTFLRLASTSGVLRVPHGGTAAYNFVFVEDVAKSVAMALEGGPSGIYNVGAGEHTTLLELARAAAATYPDRTPSVMVEPAGPETPPGFAEMSIDSARHVLNLNPVALREGLIMYRAFLDASGETG